MIVGHWYKLSREGKEFFRDIYWFQPTAIQKNGGYAGTFYTQDLERPRSHIKAKKHSVDPRWAREWTEVSEENLPVKLLETIARRSR
jgi:hypothetical protein